MAEQLLQRAQISATTQQMCGKAVPQGVGRRAVMQAKPPARALHRAANEGRGERPTARTSKQLSILRHRMWAKIDISLNR